MAVAAGAAIGCAMHVCWELCVVLVWVCAGWIAAECPAWVYCAGMRGDALVQSLVPASQTVRSDVQCADAFAMLCCRAVFLQEDAQELADPVRLARLIKQYSQFIQFPIKLWSAKKEAKQVRQQARCVAILTL